MKKISLLLCITVCGIILLLSVASHAQDDAFRRSDRSQYREQLASDRTRYPDVSKLRQETSPRKETAGAKRERAYTAQTGLPPTQAQIIDKLSGIAEELKTLRKDIADLKAFCEDEFTKIRYRVSQ